MKRRIAIILVFASLMGVVFAESNGLLKFYTADDWYALEQSQKAVLPEGLTEREAEIYRAGYANGHYDALHPAFIEGLYVLNTKTKKFHLSNCRIAIYNLAFFYQLIYMLCQILECVYVYKQRSTCPITVII